MANFGALGWLQAGAAFTTLWAGMEGGRAQRIQGERYKAAREFEAWQDDQEAGRVIASTQRTAREQQRQGRYAASRALAVAAASGGGVTDPTIVRLISNTEGEGVYRARVALYEGEARARELRLAGQAARVSGAEGVVEGRSRELGSILGGVAGAAKIGASLYEKYGQGGPNPHAGDLDSYELFSGRGIADPRFG